MLHTGDQYERIARDERHQALRAFAGSITSGLQTYFSMTKQPTITAEKCFIGANDLTAKPVDTQDRAA